MEIGIKKFAAFIKRYIQGLRSSAHDHERWNAGLYFFFREGFIRAGFVFAGRAACIRREVRVLCPVVSAPIELAAAKSAVMKDDSAGLYDYYF